MASFISHLALTVAIHGIKNKALLKRLETYWINDELARHGRYSPFLLEVQKTQDLKTHFWLLTAFTVLTLLVGLTLCACSHWAIQCLGMAVCLVATSMVANIASSMWHSFKNGALSTKGVL